MRDQTSAAWIDAPVALSLSGGGYRAAGFHLGSMQYLERVGLLGKLRWVSTVSGGTFTGAMHALSLLEKDACFDRFYFRFYELLAQTDLVRGALSGLDKPPDNASGRRTLITSIAEVYAQKFFSSETRQPRLWKEILTANTRMPSYSFNATEFRTGIAFRFDSRTRARIGNGNISVPRKQAEQIRIADIVASSSCFPGGFLPIAFPDDFVWPNGEPPEEVSQAVGGRPVALMDGGVYDNQGASSLHLAVGDRADEVGLFIISDVDRGSEDMYSVSEKKSSGLVGRLSLGQVRIFLGLLKATCLISAVTVAAHAQKALREDSFEVFWDFFFYLVPLILAGGTFTLLHGATQLVKNRVLPEIPKAGKTSWQYLRKVGVEQLADMISMRLSSLVALTSSIFMSRIRRLVYGSIYADERYENKRVANLIYDLSREKGRDSVVDAPSEQLLKVATDAAEMPTTLWFESEAQLKGLVACGQATMCNNLIKNVVERHGEDPESYPPKVKKLWRSLTEDWESLNQDPESLLPRKPA